MPIKINSTGGGSVSIDVAATGSTYTLTAPANNATIFTTDGGAITGNVGFSGAVSFASNNVSIGGQNIAPSYGMKNRIINGDFRIDQRFAGVANTISSSVTGYVQDRWKYNINDNTGTITTQQLNSSNTSASNYESGSAPPGFLNSVKMAVSAANTTPSTISNVSFYQWIEGVNVADLDYGKSTAKTVTLSFWAKSSLTGQYSVLFGGAQGGRYNPQSYTINSANTWEYKTITIPGDTTGTWLTNNSGGFYVQFWLSLGSSLSASSPPGWTSSSLYGISGNANWMGTLGNTFYITGVQLEVGPVATPFEFRQYGTELSLCQRYYETDRSKFYATQLTSGFTLHSTFKVTKRAAPTITVLSGTIGGTETVTTGGFDSYYNGNYSQDFTWSASAEL